MTQRVALVTGASRGIGKAIAEQLGKDGARLLVPSRKEMDLLSNRSIDTYIDALTEPVDILINDAGINRVEDFASYPDRDLEETLQTNLISPIRLTRGLIPGMLRRKYGRIVNVSSIWSIISKPGRLPYSVTKSGLNAFTRSLAVEVAPYNILVNAVAPGYVNTELTRQNNTEQDLDNIRKTIPMQRLAEPEEIARLVSFLCSEENTYLTGQCLLIDGGYTCQ
ncbi:MAG: SDR family oxidoreductase [Dehalococcoidia bacterium]|nr:SDR family oxidoreductase [Dehalococcoidia bacterium]